MSFDGILRATMWQLQGSPSMVSKPLWMSFMLFFNFDFNHTRLSCLATSSTIFCLYVITLVCYDMFILGSVMTMARNWCIWNILAVALYSPYSMYWASTWFSRTHVVIFPCIAYLFEIRRGCWSSGCHSSVWLSRFVVNFDILQCECSILVSRCQLTLEC